MAGNTTFFAKASESKINWKDIFSNVFKKPNKDDAARLFMAGTPLTTPHESRMIAEWRKPWLFAYMAVFMLLFVFVMSFVTATSGDVFSVIPVVFIGAFISPLVLVMLMWEMNIPRNIPIYMVLAIILIGGGISLVFTGVIRDSFFIRLYREQGAQWAGPVEETAKLLAAVPFLLTKSNKYRYVLNGMLIGAAVGAGFGAMETMGYFINLGFDYSNLIMRSIYALGGSHVAYTALSVGGLLLAKGSDRLKLKHFIDPRFLFYFVAAIALHFIWNLDGLEIYEFLVFGLYTNVKFILIMIVSWFFMLMLIKQGVRQCMMIPQIAPAYQPAYAPAPVPVGVGATQAAQPALTQPITLRCLSGIFKGGVFTSPNGRFVIGRNPMTCTIVYPQDTRGISGVHCEIRTENGAIVLTDKGSSNGTFLSDGTRLTPERPHAVFRRTGGFYLGTRENMFEIE